MNGYNEAQQRVHEIFQHGQGEDPRRTTSADNCGGSGHSRDGWLKPTVQSGRVFFFVTRRQGWVTTPQAEVEQRQIRQAGFGEENGNAWHKQKDDDIVPSAQKQTTILTTSKKLSKSQFYLTKEYRKNVEVNLAIMKYPWANRHLWWWDSFSLTAVRLLPIYQVLPFDLYGTFRMILTGW